MLFDTQILKDFQDFIEKRSDTQAEASPGNEQQETPMQAARNAVVGTPPARSYNTNQLGAAPLISAHADAEPVTKPGAPLKKLDLKPPTIASKGGLTKTIT